MDDDEREPDWRERMGTTEFWMVTGAVVFFVIVFIVVLID